jgi:outer membrane protein TolC
MKILFLILWMCSGQTIAEENPAVDLPPSSQVVNALNKHINVLSAQTEMKIGQLNQRKLSSGNYEFNVRAGTGKRTIALPDDNLKEWDIAIERPLRLPNKMLIDGDLGDEGVNRAEQALGDAYHETGRTLLHLWFNWLREQTQAQQWLQQVNILEQQTAATEKRFKAGDAPKMEYKQAQAAASQANVSRLQAVLRAQLAGAELTRQFPGIVLPSTTALSEPLPIAHDFNYWHKVIIDHNHEIELVRSEKRIQQLLADRSRADRIPDPTIGLRYANEMGGNEKVTSIYLSVPISFGLRSMNSQHAEYMAEIANNRESAVSRRLESDVYAAYAQAVSSYQTWLQAREAANNLRQNAELVTRAYNLGESNLPDTLTARRLALESTLAENITQLDANESNYRLQLDAHQLWAQDESDEHTADLHH